MIGAAKTGTAHLLGTSAVITELARIGATVATPLGVVGFIAAIAFFAYYRHLKHQETTIQQLPADQRAKRIDIWYSQIGLTIENLTRDQKYAFICQELDRRANFARLTLIILAVVFLCCFVIAAVAETTKSKPLAPALPSIVAQADRARLSAIEFRENPDTSAPPSTVFARAREELLITGLSCYRTMDIHHEAIKSLLAHRVRVRMLILDPESHDMARVEIKQSGIGVKTDIHKTLLTIKRLGFSDDVNFELRFMSFLPPFTGILVDGDVERLKDRRARAAAYMRVQPGTAYSPQHKGVIFCFTNNEPLIPVPNEKLNVFDLFSDDFSTQWREAAWSKDKVKTLLDNAN